MSNRLRSQLPAVALVALVLAASVTAPVVARASGWLEPSAPPTRDELRLPERRTSIPVAAAPTLGERAVRTALRAVGIPYRFGGESPAGGFDCSGLVRWAYGKAGVELPHSSYALHDLGRSVSRARMRPGDVLFFEGLGHVGLYLGDGRMVHAPQSGRDVEVVPLDRSSYGSRLIAVRRIDPE